MNEYLIKSAQVALLLVLVAMSSADGEFRNARRGGTNMGLFPFPRVGRSDPSLASAYADLREAKRQGLIPFPRVGRSDLKTSAALAPWLLADTYSFHKRNNGGGQNLNRGGQNLNTGGENVNGGMWFGPRLGRLQKRSFEDGENPWTLVALKEPSFKQTDYASRLGLESEEDNDDTIVEEVLSRRMDSKSRNNISQQ